MQCLPVQDTGIPGPSLLLITRTQHSYPHRVMTDIRSHYNASVPITSGKGWLMANGL